MRIAIHQPNFIPWFPFFYKMAIADQFILLRYVQFEKNNYQNRYKIGDKWVTNPVHSGLDQFIEDKIYVQGGYLRPLNERWIRLIADTLCIKTEIINDVWTDSKSTQKLIDLIKINGGTTYITNPDAKNKYLDEDLMRSQGIEIEYCNVPKDLNIHVFEAFEKFGIDGCIKQLNRAKECQKQLIL